MCINSRFRLTHLTSVAFHHHLLLLRANIVQHTLCFAEFCAKKSQYLIPSQGFSPSFFGRVLCVLESNERRPVPPFLLTIQKRGRTNRIWISPSFIKEEKYPFFLSSAAYVRWLNTGWVTPPKQRPKKEKCGKFSRKEECFPGLRPHLPPPHNMPPSLDLFPWIIVDGRWDAAVRLALPFLLQRKMVPAATPRQCH